MIERIVIISAIILVYYNIGGLATTNILRLTVGNTLKIYSSKCICDSCGSQIPPLYQFPIVSFIICKGRCKFCGSKIPLFPLLLEIFVFVGMCLIAIALNFTIISVLISFLYYEIVRIVVVIIKGRRNNQFFLQYFISVISMIPFLLISVFISLIHQMI